MDVNESIRLCYKIGLCLLTRALGFDFKLQRESKIDKMKAENTTCKTQTRTAKEILKLPPEQRNLILETAAKCAEKDYCNDLALTDFNAFSEDDFYGDSSCAEQR